jgi:hypothetical protein
MDEVFCWQEYCMEFEDHIIEQTNDRFWYWEKLAVGLARSMGD